MAEKRGRATGTTAPPLTVQDKKRLWRKLLGDIGEQIVFQFLTANGWQIVCRKFRIGRSTEIDIIAISPSGITAFIEVKTRTVWPDSVSTWHESATQSIDYRKQKRIISASRQYRIANRAYDLESCRYDIFLVGLSHQLASNFADLKMNPENEKGSLLSSAIDRCLLDYSSGKTDTCLHLIHLESAFVTNF